MMLRLHSSESGNALIELALVFPIIAFMAFGGLELARSLRTRQIASALSREAASIAYRDCSSERNNVLGGRNDLDACFENVRDLILSRSGSVAPGANLVLSLFEHDGAATRLALVGDTGSLTKIDLDEAVDPATTLGQAIQSHEIVVVAEIFVPFDPIVGITSALFGNDLFYDATIM